MKPSSIAATAALTLITLGGVVACASAPQQQAAAAAALDCAALDAEIARAAQAQQAAAQQRQDAWKAVVPFAVMARYGQGKAALDASEQRLAELQAQATRQGCPARGR